MTDFLTPIGAIEAVTGSLTDEDRTLAEALLGEASDLAREIGRGWTDVAGGDVAPTSVRLAVKRSVLRAYYEDPEGYTDERLGDWQGSRPEGDPDQRGVYFTSREEATIRSAAGRRGSTGTIRVRSAYGDDGIPGTLYAPVEGGSPVPFVDAGEAL